MVDEKTTKGAIKAGSNRTLYDSREAPDRPGITKGKPRPPSKD